MTARPRQTLSQELLSYGMTHKLAGAATLPLAGAAALGIPLAAYLGYSQGESSGQADSKRRAMLGFGSGLAAGVAAPRLVGKLKGVLDNVQNGGSAMPGKPGAPQRRAPQGGQTPHLGMYMGQGR